MYTVSMYFGTETVCLSVCMKSDPLGLNAAPAEGGESNLGNGQRKRRSSEEQGAGPNSIKRVKVKKINGHGSVYDIKADI